MTTRNPNAPSLRVVHVLRAPLGGLFRHVLDLTREQIARGHQVGLITDANTGGDRATEILGELEPQLALGVMRLPMQRLPHWSSAWQVRRRSAIGWWSLEWPFQLVPVIASRPSIQGVTSPQG